MNSVKSEKNKVIQYTADADRGRPAFSEIVDRVTELDSEKRIAPPTAGSSNMLLAQNAFSLDIRVNIKMAGIIE